MIDLERIKESIDLLDICRRDTNISDHPLASTEGGEYKGPCPFCGGRDRFSVQPNKKPFPKWYCRKCTPGGGSVIDYIAKRDQLDPTKFEDLTEICKRATGGEIPTNTTQSRPVKQYIKPAYEAPAKDWQESAQEIINICKARLQQEPKAIAYLKARGLTERTINDFDLGYSPEMNFDDLYIPRGITIPCKVSNHVWYIKVRLPSKPGQQKYTLVKGSKPAAIYNGDWLSGSEVALFCEGEFDCMIAHQELNDIMACATLGSATNTLDLATWGAYLLPLKVILSVYDNDKAGSEGAQRLAELAGKRVRNISIPEGKDINDFYKADGNLYQWIKPSLADYITDKGDNYV